MMYLLYQWWEQNQDLLSHFSFLRIFKYITFRSAYAAITSLIIAFIIGPRIINWMKELRVKQAIRKDGPQSHFAKEGTPTMGGLIIILSLTISILLWGNLANHYVQLLIFVLWGSGLLGFLDDYLKVKYHNPKGISGKIKLIWLSFLGFVVMWIVNSTLSPDLQCTTSMLFMKNYLLHMPLFLYGCFILFIFVGTSNAVNLTDGMDGLAIGITTFVSITFAIIAYIIGHIKFSSYLGLTHIPNSGEITVFIAAMLGSCLGFLWYNAYPAMIFMGDVGSLSLGAVLATIAIILKQEFLLAILGGIYVAEALSVMLQVGVFKFTKKYSKDKIGKRVFRMAPLHHHFEKMGIPEQRLVIRFWIVAIILMMIGLSTLKLR